MQLDLNLAIQNLNHPSRLDNFANNCLKPYRYFYNGRDVTILNERVIHTELSFPSLSEKNFLTTAWAIAMFVPGVICGVLARIASATFAKNRAIVAQVNQPQKELSLEEYYTEHLQPLAQKIDKQLKEDFKIWQNLEFIKDFSQLIEKGYEYIELYFKKLSNECKGDAVAMRDRMVIQPQNRKIPGDNGQNFSQTFFYFSKFYHFARACVYHESPDDPFVSLNPLPKDMQDPYFDPTKPQYRWRELYNAFCDKVDQNGLRELLEASKKGDGRYTQWSIHDSHKVKHFVSAPTTIPT